MRVRESEKLASSARLVAGVDDDVLVALLALAVAVAAWTWASRRQRRLQPQPQSNRRMTTTRGGGGGCCPICLTPPAASSTSSPSSVDSGHHRLETNCGHAFCVACFLAYVAHHEEEQWQCSVRCPVCRQRVSLLLLPPDVVAGDATRAVDAFNARHGGDAGSWLHALRDAPALLRHLSADVSSLRALAAVARVRLLALAAAALAYLVSPLDLIPEALVGVLGLLDDVVVLLAFALYVSLLYRQLLTSRRQ